MSELNPLYKLMYRIYEESTRHDKVINEIQEEIEKLDEDIEGLCLDSVDLVNDYTYDEKYLYNSNDNRIAERQRCYGEPHFVYQVEDCEDCYHGYLYYPTEIKGQYVKFSFWI